MIKSVMTELITVSSDVDAGAAEEEPTERTMEEEEASDIASEIAPKAKRPTREEVAAAKAAEARRAAETKAAAKEAAARRAAIIERAEAEAAKVKAANMAANKAVGTEAKAKSGGKAVVVGGGVGPGAASSKGSPSNKPKR
jgi:colicin import membrane protein